MKKASPMQYLLQTAAVLGATLALAACGDEYPRLPRPPEPTLGGGDEKAPDDDAAAIERELNAFEIEANKRARRVCGLPEDTPEEELEGEALDCVFEFSIGPEPCETELMIAHPDEARALIACTEYELELQIACCTEDGPCTAEKAWECGWSLLVEDGPCADELADAAFDRLDACE